MSAQAITALLGFGVLLVSAYLHIKGADGDWWGFVALCLIVKSCQQGV